MVSDSTSQGRAEAQQNKDIQAHKNKDARCFWCCTYIQKR